MVTTNNIAVNVMNTNDMTFHSISSSGVIGGIGTTSVGITIVEVVGYSISIVVVDLLSGSVISVVSLIGVSIVVQLPGSSVVIGVSIVVKLLGSSN